MKNIKKLLCIVLALISVFAFNACGKTDSNKEKEEDTTYAPATAMELNTIYADFYDNELNAKESHEGQRYKITATATEITETHIIVTEKIVHPACLTGSFRVTVNFDESQLEFVKTLSRGNTVTFEGTLSNLQSGSWMDFEDVVFISKVD